MGYNVKEKDRHENGEASYVSPRKRSRNNAERVDQECESERMVRTEENSQWLFRNGNSPEMVISEHLGDTSSMVDSMTHMVKSWSLISSSKVSNGTTKKRVNSSNRALMKVLLGVRESMEQGGVGKGN
jgi:hypothetical protein